MGCALHSRLHPRQRSGSSQTVIKNCWWKIWVCLSKLIAFPQVDMMLRLYIQAIQKEMAILS